MSNLEDYWYKMQMEQQFAQLRYMRSVTLWDEDENYTEEI